LTDRASQGSAVVVAESSRIAKTTVSEVVVVQNVVAVIVVKLPGKAGFASGVKRGVACRVGVVLAGRADGTGGEACGRGVLSSLAGLTDVHAR